MSDIILPGKTPLIVPDPTIKSHIDTFNTHDADVDGHHLEDHASRHDPGGADELIPAWDTWSPTYQNLTIGDGTVVARFFEVGELVIAKWVFTLGSSSSVGTVPTVSRPVTASSSYGTNDDIMGGAKFQDAATDTFFGYVNNASTTLFDFYVFNAAGTHLSDNSITASVPFTWATGDVMSFTATYEAA